MGSMSNHEKHRMEPLSGETVEADGVYRNEWGRDEQMKRGETFPSDPYGTGLSFTGGLANGHPAAGKPKAGGRRKTASGQGGPAGSQGEARPAGSRAAGPKTGPKTGKPASRNVKNAPARTAKPAEGKGGAGKPRSPGRRTKESASRGDDWQPSGASAHESRLGVMGGRRH